MVNHKSPLEASNTHTLEKLNEHEHVRDFLDLCFNRDKAARPSAATLLQHPLLKDM